MLFIHHTPAFLYFNQIKTILFFTLPQFYLLLLSRNINFSYYEQYKIYSPEGSIKPHTP